MPFDPDKYLAAAKPASFDPDAYLAAKTPAKEPDESHDFLPFLKDTAKGLVKQADEFSSKPLPSIAYDHLVQPAVDAFNKSRDSGKNVVNSALDAGAQGTGDLAALGTGLVTPEIAPVHAYMQSRQNGNSHDDALKDARNVAVLIGAPKLSGPIADAAGWVGKKVAKAGAGVSEGSIDRYLANPEAVNSATDLPTKTKEFLADADARAAQGSADSTAAFNTLRDSGHETSIKAFTNPLLDEARRLEDLGNFGPERKAAVGWLRGLVNDIKVSAKRTPDVEPELNEAALHNFMHGEDPTAVEGLQDYPETMTLDKGKALLNVLDSKLQTAAKQGADTQVLRSLSDARKSIDSFLKATVPEYAEQMDALRANTQAATSLTDRFRTDQGALNTLKRVQNGKDPFATEALQGYDKQFGTKFGDDLQNSYAKNDFSKQTTNGSRKAVTMGAAGAAIGNHIAPGAGGYVGGAIGAGLGALADIYGGTAVKAALDAGINLKKLANTPFIKPIMEAAQRGPKAATVTHALMSQRFPAYKATQTDDEP